MRWMEVIRIEVWVAEEISLRVDKRIRWWMGRISNYNRDQILLRIKILLKSDNLLTLIKTNIRACIRRVKHIIQQLCNKYWKKLPKEVVKFSSSRNLFSRNQLRDKKLDQVQLRELIVLSVVAEIVIIDLASSRILNNYHKYNLIKWSKENKWLDRLLRLYRMENKDWKHSLNLIKVVITWLLRLIQSVELRLKYLQLRMSIKWSMRQMKMMNISHYHYNLATE